MRQLIRSELTPRQRDMLLAELSRMHHEEIARHMGLMRYAVYKLGHDARKALRKALEAVGYGVDPIRALVRALSLTRGRRSTRPGQAYRRRAGRMAPATFPDHAFSRPPCFLKNFCARFPISSGVRSSLWVPSPHS